MVGALNTSGVQTWKLAIYVDAWTQVRMPAYLPETVLYSDFLWLVKLGTHGVYSSRLTGTSTIQYVLPFLPPPSALAFYPLRPSDTHLAMADAGQLQLLPNKRKRVTKACLQCAKSRRKVRTQQYTPKSKSELATVRHRKVRWCTALLWYMSYSRRCLHLVRSVHTTRPAEGLPPWCRRSPIITSKNRQDS